MRAQNELLDAIQVLIDKSLKDKATKVTGGKVKSASGGLATVTINGYDYSIPYSGDAPKVGSTVRVFIPNGNMSDAFIGGGGGGGGGSSTTNYNSLTNKPSINGVVLYGDQASKDLKLYGDGNQPPYPVTSVNGQTGDVMIEAGGVTSVNGKSGDVTLTAGDVGALPSTTKIPSATSDLINDSGYITAAAAPVQSVNAKTGAVVLTQDDVGNGTTYVRTHNDFTDAAKQQINTNKDNIATLDSDMEAAQGDITTLKGNVTTLTTALQSKQDKIAGGASTITDDNLTANRALVSNGSGKVAVSAVTATELGYLDGVTSNIQTQLNKKLESAPVTSVNTKTGAVVLTAADVGALPTSGGTLTGNLTVGSAKIQTNGYVVGTWLQGTATNHLTNAATKIAVQDGSGWVYHRTAEEIKSDIGLSNVDNVKQYSASNPPPYPVASVNGKTGTVNLVASDVGAVSTANVTQTLGTSTTKVPSEKAVADALSGAGAGDMLKATYDPTGSVAQAGGIPDYVAGQLPTVNDATLTIQKNGAAVGTFTANASANKSINITMAKGDVGLSNVDNVKQYSASNPPPYPVTSVNGQTGDVVIEAGGGTTIVLSASQPSGLKAGDYWYQIVT